LGFVSYDDYHPALYDIHSEEAATGDPCYSRAGQ
jgi:hypothetical protein